MTKKKASKKKHQEDATFADTSEEEFNDSSKQVKCPHISKAVNFGRIKKKLKTASNINTCTDCEDKKEDNIDEESEIWMCLQCGNCGCGRTSQSKHAILHNKKLYSDCHAIVLSISSGNLWCYDCDSEVHSSSSNLKQCVDFIMKFASKKENTFVFKSVNKEASTVKENSPVETNKEDNKLVIGEKKSVIEEKGKKNSKELQKVVAGKKFISNDQKPQVKGLQNLGNTCFFNAVMQNLIQTSLLEHELTISSNPEYLWEVPHLSVSEGEIIEDQNNENLKVELSKHYPLVHNLLQFLKQMVNSAKIINPSALFTEISKKSPQFRHFQQQDSHELLRQLLDGVRQEEIRRQKKGILKALKLENITPENVNEEIKKLVKAYGCYASHTLVEKIFGGLLISTVLCEECKMSSQVFEPFMDLSLPVFEEKSTRNQKTDKDLDENCDNEFILTKEKRDYSKPSKHQEKKLKQQAKKAKKKGRILRPLKKSSFDLDENSTNLSVPENLTSVNDENDKEQESEKSDVINDEKEECMNETHDTVDDVQHQNEENQLPKETICDGVLEFESKPVEVELMDDNIEIQPTEVPGTADISVASNIENDCLDSSEIVTKCAQHDHGDSSLLENPSALEDGLQALCSQIKDIRIRRDSDRQESFLNSSRSISDCESQKLNTSHESFAEDTNCTEKRDNWSRSLSEQHSREWIMRSLTTLKQRCHPSPLERSINSCLIHFTKSELLTGSNKFRCENCTDVKQKKSNSKTDVVYTNASKQLLIFSPPAILTLHLKRFQQVGMSLRKDNKFVDFPLILDLAPYCSSASLILPHMAAVKDEVLYSLYGIVEHSGRLSSGHYTAYVKVSQRTANHSFMSNWPLGQCDLEQLLQKFSKINFSIKENDHSINCEEDCKWFYISDSHVKEVNESEVLRCQAYLLFYQRIK